MPSNEVHIARRKLTAVTPNPDYRRSADDLQRELPAQRTYWERRHGLTKMAEYITTFLRELDGSDRPFGLTPPLEMLEIGPGVGMWMEFMLAMGHEVEGIDAPPANARMQIFEEMTLARDLSVAYIGFEDVMNAVAAGGDLGHRAQCYHLIHLRGSLDAVVGKFTDDVQRKRVRQFARSCVALLNPGGLVHVSHNKNGMLPLILDELEKFEGLKFEKLDDQTTRHWLNA